MIIKDGSPFDGLNIHQGDYAYIQRQMAKYLQAEAELRGLADRWDKKQVTTSEYQSRGNVLRYDMQCARKNIEAILDISTGRQQYKIKSVKKQIFGDDE